MELCQDHWHELKNAIRQRGMWSLVASVRSPGDAERNPSGFDPLMMASLLISEQALMAFGTYLLTHHCCPLCEVEQNLGKGQSFEWIDADADTVLDLCRERHLIHN